MTLCSKFNGTLSENRFGERFFPNNSKETLLLLDIFFIYKTLALPTCNLLIQQSKKINCINQPLRRNFIFLSDRGWSTGRTRVMTSVILDVCHPSSISARQLFLQPLNAAAEANSQWRSESRLQCAIASLRPHRVQGSKPTTWSRQWGSLGDWHSAALWSGRRVTEGLQPRQGDPLGPVLYICVLGPIGELNGKNKIRI